MAIRVVKGFLKLASRNLLVSGGWLEILIRLHGHVCPSLTSLGGLDNAIKLIAVPFRPVAAENSREILQLSEL